MILHYISSLGTIKVSEFNDLVFNLKESVDENIKKKANYLRYQLQDLGFIDYDSTNGILVINKSQIVIKPTKEGTTVILTGARDPKLIEDIAKFIVGKEITLDIQNQVDDLLPQIVLMKFLSNKLSHVENLAKNLELSFMKNGLYEQYALGMFFSSIENWQQLIHVENVFVDAEGGEIFDINKLEFIEKPENFDRQLAFIKFSNINGYKTIYRLWFEGLTYNISEQQYGIYLMLYLFNNKMIGLNEKNKCINILIYDKGKNYLAVPLNCRLPRYLTLSISLLSGKKPEIKTIEVDGKSLKGKYLIYKNVSGIFAANMIGLKLKQKLIENVIIL